MLALRNKNTGKFATVEESDISDWYTGPWVSLSEKRNNDSIKMMLLVEEEKRGFLENLLNSDRTFGVVPTCGDYSVTSVSLRKSQDWEIVRVNLMVE